MTILERLRGNLCVVLKVLCPGLFMALLDTTIESATTSKGAHQ
jgi:hypothetical protein